MPAYLYIPGISGTATARGYEKWIEIDSFKVAAGRELPMMNPASQRQTRCIAKASEFMVGKIMDACTALLFQQVCTSAAVDYVQLELCRQTPRGLQAYGQYTLQSVIFSQYAITAVRNHNAVQSKEWLALNFTRLEQRYMPATGAPVAAHVDIASHQPNFSHLPPAVWVYQQSTGQLTKNGKHFAFGYAGCGSEAKNNPTYQYEHGVNMHIPEDAHICQLGAGPLPTGRYTVGPIGTYRVGPNAMPLIPDAANVMLGRNKFYIHSDSKKHPGYSSDGCIVISDPNIRLNIAAGVEKGENTFQVVP